MAKVSRERGRPIIAPKATSINHHSKEFADFFDRLFFQVGIMRVFLCLFLEDLRNEFKPKAPEVLDDWRNSTDSLRYLGEPAFRFLDRKWESPSDDSDSRDVWQHLLRKNNARLVCFQNVVRECMNLFKDATSFEDIGKKLTSQLRFAYLMCSVWQDRIAGDLVTCCPDKSVEVRILEKLSVWGFSSVVTSKDYDQPDTFRRFFKIPGLIAKLQEQITLTERADITLSDTEDPYDVTRPPLGMCMATRRLFIALLHAFVTNREILQNRESVAEYLSLFQDAVAAAKKFKDGNGGGSGDAVAASLRTLEHRLILITILFGDQTFEPVVRAASISSPHAAQLTENERLLVPDCA